jgi:hypothetical protein
MLAAYHEQLYETRNDKVKVFLPKRPEKLKNKNKTLFKVFD